MRIPKSAKLVMGFVAGVGAAELACRLVFRHNVESLRFSSSDLYYYYDRAGYRRNLPGKTGYERMWDGKGKAEFRINSLGFRGPEIAARKPAGTFRILFVGDSITLGGRLPEADTFVRRIGEALENRSSPRVEVMNAGVGDVGLAEEEDTMRGSGLQSRPDAVVLCWYLNDARPPVGFPEEVVYGNSFISWFDSHPWARKSYLAGFLYDFVRKSLVERRLSRSRRFDWIADYRAGEWSRDPGAFASMVKEARYDWGDAWNDASMRSMEAKIKELRDFAAARGMKFALVAFPEQAQVYARFKAPWLVDRPQNDLSAFADKARIPFLNLLPILRSHAREPIFYDNCHYTPRGNAVVAQAILKFLKTRELLQGDRAEG